jgi:excisionase family DNA binding protein
MMTELLTTRQVQNLLKVDRITIYRMVQDGRLKGVKIGQQWRFQQSEVQRLLNGAAPEENQTALKPPLPVHCLQTIQELFSRISRLGGLVVDDAGEPVTALSGDCTLCRMLQAAPGGAQACRRSWQEMAAAAAAGEREFTCHAGLTCLAAPVMDGEALAAWFLAGQVRLSPADAEELAARARELAADYALPLSAVQEALRKVPVIPSDQHDLLSAWVIDAARAMESILQERAGFVQRMQQIADLTQIS